ncbi:MAG: hypothetical protein JNJ59_00435 [Deltaproteobacteria bacterium]|nr:hypothetical protein [Deltaproteobacteria bacterium]
MPAYELRAEKLGHGGLLLEVWQLPSLATPSLVAPRRVAGLSGKNLEQVEYSVLKDLRASKIDPTRLGRGERGAWRLSEDAALRLGLLFRVLAPMRRRDSIGLCLAGIAGMAREEAAYWLGMAMHRKNPRRVLSALRMLLVDA